MFIVGFSSTSNHQNYIDGDMRSQQGTEVEPVLGFDVAAPMPTFCRHNRLIQNCPICSREQSVELRPVISSSAPRSSQDRAGDASGSAASVAARGARRTAACASNGSPAAPTTATGRRWPPGCARAPTRSASRRSWRLRPGGWRCSRRSPPGLYAEVADGNGDLEDRTWLAFLIAYLAPLEDDDPFASIRRVWVPWRSVDDAVAGGRPDRAADGPRSQPRPRDGRGVSRVGRARRAHRRPPSAATARGLPNAGSSGRSSASRCRGCIGTPASTCS